MKTMENFSFEALMERLDPCSKAGDEGGNDGSRNFPREGTREKGPFQVSLLGRAKNEVKAATNWLHGQTQKFFDFAQTFGAEPKRPQQATRALRQKRVEQIEEEVAQNRKSVETAKEAVLAASRKRAAAFDKAGAEVPAQTPASIGSFLAICAFIGAVEGLVAYAVLVGTVEPLAAMLSGFLIPVVMLLLGGLSGYLCLRPKDKSKLYTKKRIGKFGLAASIGVFASGITAVVAAWRTALLSGLDGNTEEIISILSEWDGLVAHWETHALLALSITAFSAAFLKVRAFFLGHEPALRASELALREAELALRNRRNEIAERITDIGGGARLEIAGIISEHVEHAQALSRRAKALTGDILHANHVLVTIQDAADAIDATYRAANEYVRTSNPPAWLPLTIESCPFPVPPEIEEIAKQAIERCEFWNDAANTEAALLSSAEFGALAYIDSLADTRPTAEQLTQPVSNSLPWRVAA